MEELEAKWEKYRRVVPLNSDALLKEMSDKITNFRDDLIFCQRECMILQLVKKVESLPPPLPSRENVFDVLNVMPDVLMQKIHPQQIQFCTFVVGFVYQNPQIFAKAVIAFCKQAGRTTVSAVAGSVIPAVYGFYSSNEHISYAFPFFCSVVSTAPRDLVTSVLLPFYCSSCTLRFIENVYALFGLKLCHDVRYDTDEQSETIVKRYGSVFQQAVADSFCLLSQSHQFLLRYMKNQGWTKKDVMNFFLRDFVLQQLLRYVKSTPFKRHFHQLKYFSGFVHADADFCQPLYHVIDHGKAIYEIPFAYEGFDCQYVRLLMTSYDVDMMIKILLGIGALPGNVKPFLDPRSYFEISYEPFMFRVFSRGKPPACDPIDQWRPIVFGEKIDDFEVMEDKSYERTWKHLVNISEQDGRKDPIEKLKTPAIQAMIGKEKIGPFTKYAIQRYLNLLNNRAVLFERFIVHKMYSQTLQQWNELVRSYRDMIRVPLVLEATSTALHLINSKRLTTLPDALQIIKLYPMFELAYVIQHYLPLIVDKAMTQELEEIDTAWTLMVMDVRQKLALPPSCKHGRMNQLVWQAIEHFKCVNFVEFRDTLQVMLESVEFVEVIPDEHDLVIQFVIAFSDVANLPSKFLLLDSLIMKQNKVPAFKTTDHNIYRWSCLESGVLKLIANDDALTERYVACGKKLMQLTNCYAKS